jgi:hypothetical protein
MRKVFFAFAAAVLFLALTFGVIQLASGQTPTPGEKPLPNTREIDGENRREVSGPTIIDSPQQPSIGFIDSPSATCYQPDPALDSCYISWYYMNVNASPNYMTAMTVTLNSIGTVVRVNGFFQTSMYVPYNMLGNGIRVPCGSPGLGNAGPNLGAAYAWTIRAVDSAGLQSANYGTANCPAYAP